MFKNLLLRNDFNDINNTKNNTLKALESTFGYITK